MIKHDFNIKDIIYIITSGQTGGTFVDWTMNYLTGETRVSRNDGEYYPITHNPLTKNNAHVHDGRCRNTIERIETAKNMGDKIIYYSPAEMIAEIDSEIDSLNNIILLSNRYNAMYSAKLDRIESWNEQALMSDIIDRNLIWHKEVVERFKQLNLNLYDWSVLRELLAMTVDIKHNRISDDHVDLNKYNIFILDTRELYTTLDIIIFEIFNFFNLTIDKTRLDNWKIQYFKWRDMQYGQNKFSLNFDRIIDYTLNGINYDLTYYKLDVVQEAYILKELIRKGLYLAKDCKYKNTKEMFDNLEDINKRELPIIRNDIK